MADSIILVKLRKITEQYLTDDLTRILLKNNGIPTFSLMAVVREFLLTAIRDDNSRHEGRDQGRFESKRR